MERGETSLQQFDFFYARENLGRPAWLWMQDLIATHRESDPDLTQLVQEPVRQGYPPLPASQTIDFRARVSYRPGPFPVPDDLHAAMQLSEVAAVVHAEPVDELILIQADLEQDGEPEYVLAGALENSLVASGFHLEGGVWRELPLRLASLTLTDPGQTLLEGEIRLLRPPFRHLQIGDIILQVQQR